MTKSKQNPVLNFALEYGPMVVLILAFKFGPFPDGASNGEQQVARVLFAAGVTVPAVLIAISYSWFVEMHLRKLAVVSSAIMILFCGLTVWSQYSTLITNRVNIAFLACGGVIGFGLLRGKSYMSYLSSEGRMILCEEGWLIFTKRITLFFFGYVIVTELLGHYADAVTWVVDNRIFPTIAFIGFLVAQIGLVSEYGMADED